MKRFYAFTVVLLILSHNVKADTDNLKNQEYIYTHINSPQTYNFTKYGNTPVSYFNGKIDLRVPIYTYEDKDFNIPIFLGYNSSGFKPNQREGIVGLNWFLNAGGVITRRVNGFPDDTEGIFDIENIKLHGFYYGIKNKLLNTINKTNIHDIGKFWSNLYYNLTINKCEFQSDEYTVNAPGLNGTFYIENDGNVHFVGGKNYRVDLSNYSLQESSGTEINSSTIIITNDQGYKYYFGGNIQYLEISYPFSGIYTPDQAGRSIINGWHLTKILAPNGRSVKYFYNSYDLDNDVAEKKAPDSKHFLLDYYTIDIKEAASGHTDFLTKSIGYSSSYSSESNIYQVLKTVYLKGIQIDSVDINFSYQQRTNKFYTDLLGRTDYDQLTLMLDSVNVKYKNNTLKRYALQYSYAGSRYFLDSFQEIGVPSYKFTYYNQSNLPRPTTHGIDYWGFWNGGADGGNLIPSLTYSEDGTINYTGEERKPNESKCNAGLLKQTNYPTGGYSYFEYEGNRYSQRLERRNDNNYIPALYNEDNLLAGGARIKTIIDNDGNGSENTRTFLYYKNYPNTDSSSGILLDWPRYIFGYKFDCSDKNGIYMKKQSQSFNQNHISSEDYIQYSEVTELQSSTQGYTTYKFTNFNTNPDICDCDSFVVFSTCVENLSLFNNYVGVRMNDCSFQRGYPYKKTVYNKDGLRIYDKKVTSFIKVSDYPDNYSFSMMQTGSLGILYKNYHCPFLPLSETETFYSGSDSIYKINTYEYDNNGLNTKTTMINSDGTMKIIRNKYIADFQDEISKKHDSIYSSMKKSILTNYQEAVKECKKITSKQQVAEEMECLDRCENSYIYSINQIEKHISINNSVISKMIDKNIISPVIETNAIHKSIDGSQKIINSELIEYNLFGDSLYLPQKKKNIYSNNLSLNDFNEVTISDNGAIVSDSRYDDEISFINYDNVGNPIKIKNKNGIYTYYIWAYNSLNPIAKIESAENVTISNIIDDSKLSYSDNIEDIKGDVSYLQNLLSSYINDSNYMVTYYTYRPLVGMTSATAPNGVTTFYEYDAFNRLKRTYIKENNVEKTVQTYDYHYKQ